MTIHEKELMRTIENAFRGAFIDQEEGGAGYQALELLACTLGEALKPLFDGDGKAERDAFIDACGVQE